MIILGIDPGFTVTGFAIARKTPEKTAVVEFGHLSLKSKDHLKIRTKEFFEFFSEKIKEYNVTHLSIETPFLGKNAQSFLKLGYLRGILYLLSAQHDLALYEFSPREVKQAVTGKGGATKEQVALMMGAMFPRLTELNKTVKQDVTDALAICLTGIWAGE